MSRKAKVCATVGLLIGLGLSALAVYAHLAEMRSRGERSFDLDWLNTASEQELEEYEAWFQALPPRQKRKLAHRALDRPDANHHDALLTLVGHGKDESVPYLLDWLKAQGDFQGGGMVCTRAHCLEALEKITGKELGCDYSDWEDWDR